MQHFAEGSPTSAIDVARAGALVNELLRALGRLRRVLLVPPDFTRRHSWGGELAVLLYERLKGAAHVEILPALGTHAPMSAAQLADMFPGIPPAVFRVHDWRRDVIRLGEVPGETVGELTQGRLHFSVSCEVNRLLVEGGWDRIISIGQLVPHEVAGISNHAKNIFVGTGGQDTINKTHFLGAVCGMEVAMGRTHTPVRAVLDYMRRHIARDLPVTYLLTVRARAAGQLVTRGLYAGDDEATFERGAMLCRQVNVDLLDHAAKRVVVYLEPREFRSTWLGNKAIYRTRMALADGGELIVLAPGVETFGEDAEIDRLIRTHGYRGTAQTLRAVAEQEDLAQNLAAAAHLIHGSSEGRFRVTYCPGGLTRAEVEGVGYAYGDLELMSARYDPASLAEGWNDVAGEEIFYVPNPALGLWALRSRFEDEA